MASPIFSGVVTFHIPKIALATSLLCPALARCGVLKYSSSGLRHTLLFTQTARPHVLKRNMSKFVYPETKTVPQVDIYHGVKVYLIQWQVGVAKLSFQVEDPYRWLEDDVRNSKEVDEWVAQQTKFTFDYLEKLGHRNVIKERLTDMWNYEKFSAPWKVRNILRCYEG